MTTARNSWRHSRLILIASATLAFSASTDAFAHRRDEYLQAARIAIDPARVELELDLTPGIALAASLLDGFDPDQSGTISEAEARAYASAVLRDLKLEVDDRPLQPELVAARPPATEAVVGGEGILRLRWTAAMPPLAAGSHQLMYRNRHRPDISVYLANVLVPADERLAVTAQRRSANQDEFRVDFAVEQSRTRAIPPLLLVGVAAGILGILIAWRRRTC